MDQPILRARLLRVLAAALLLCALAPAVLWAQSRVERGNLVTEGIPDPPPALLERLQQYQNTRAATLAGWLPGGGGMLITTRFGETNQVHLVTQPGGARRQITFFGEPVGGVAVPPGADARGFLFTKDVGGSEFYQVYHFDLDTGAYRMLTDGRSRNGGAVWANRAERFVYGSTRRNGRDTDLYLGTPTDTTARLLLQREGSWSAADWSPDDTRLLVVRYVSANETEPYLLDVASGGLTRFNPSPEKVFYGMMTFSRDGRGVYFTSDQGSEFQRLRYYDLVTGAQRSLSDDIPWDVEEFALSPDGRWLAFVANEDGIGRLHLLDLSAGRRVDVPDLPLGLVYGLSFSPESDRLGLVVNTPRAPGDVYALDLASRRLVRWTFSETGGLPQDRFVEPTLVRYPTFDEVDGRPRTIPAFLYKPRGQGPFPVVIDIHGGPEGQAVPTFNPFYQFYLAEMGVAVLVPNVRGSSGYGKSYLMLDNGYRREDSVRDIGALLDWIGTQPDLDAGRVAVSGGSYGGYMVLAALTHYNDRLRAGIDVVGISNFVTFLENTQDYRRDLRRVEYGDERDPEMRAFLNRISPTTNASKITKPLFVAQGQNDPRVPVTESEQMVATIRRGGGTVWYLLARDEGHGFAKKTNRDYYQAAAVLFLDRYLLSRPGQTD